MTVVVLRVSKDAHELLESLQYGPVAVAAVPAPVVAQVQRVGAVVVGAEVMLTKHDPRLYPEAYAAVQISRMTVQL